MSSGGGSPLHKLSPLLLCPRNAWKWGQLGWRQTDINSLTCERKVSLVHTSHSQCANNKQQQFIVQETPWRWDLVAQRVWEEAGRLLLPTGMGLLRRNDEPLSQSSLLAGF